MIRFSEESKNFENPTKNLKNLVRISKNLKIQGK
jgi:hypothetical protein